MLETMVKAEVEARVKGERGLLDSVRRSVQVRVVARAALDCR